VIPQLEDLKCNTHATHQTNLSIMQAAGEELRAVVAQISPAIIDNNDHLQQIKKSLLENRFSAEQLDVSNLHNEIESVQSELEGLSSIIRGINVESQVAAMRELVCEVRGLKKDCEMSSSFEDIKQELIRVLNQEQTQKAIADLRKEVSALLLHPNTEVNGVQDLQDHRASVSKLQYADSRLSCVGTPITKVGRRLSEGSLEDRSRGGVDAPRFSIAKTQTQRTGPGELEASQVIVHLQDAIEERGPSNAERRSSSLTVGSHVDLEALRGLEELFHSDGAIDHMEPDWLVNCS